MLFLCGGSGRRMYPLGEDKYLLKFLGRTLLEHQVRLAVSAGLKHFIFVTNPRTAACVMQDFGV